MKLWIGSRPGAAQLSAPTGQLNCGKASLGVSATKSPDAEQPLLKVWWSISQWPPARSGRTAVGSSVLGTRRPVPGVALLLCRVTVGVLLTGELADPAHEGVRGLTPSRWIVPAVLPR